MNTLVLTILISVLLILIAVFLLSFKILLFKGGKFPNIHIGESKELRDKGITCATSQDAEARKPQKKYNISTNIKEIDVK